MYISKIDESGFFAGSDAFMDMVVLRRMDGRGPDTEVFVYYPASRDLHIPVMAWLSPNELEITIDRVEEIYKQKSEACGIRITYRIGEVAGP